MRHGSNIDPPNRFESNRFEADFEHLELADQEVSQAPQRAIEYFTDGTKSIVTENKSPDIPFRYSINPYRGCVHACSYCYARNTHEYLGFNAGLDFETKIMVKPDAPQLLREFLSAQSWKPEPIVFSGVTDCYQPAERDYRLTRGCLEVALACNQPVGIITKNALVLRDLDLLSQLAVRRLVNVFLSINSLDAELARDMEPRTSTPRARLRAVAELSAAGIPVGVMVAPIIPGLNDDQIPAVLGAARDAGAKTAGTILLRLPLTVEAVFEEWLRRVYPLRADKVLGQLKQMREGKLNGSEFGKRMVGSGPLAEQIRSMFKLFALKFGLDQRLPQLDCSQFMPPQSKSGQQLLF